MNSAHNLRWARPVCKADSRELSLSYACLALCSPSKKRWGVQLFASISWTYPTCSMLSVSELFANHLTLFSSIHIITLVPSTSSGHLYTLISTSSSAFSWIKFSKIFCEIYILYKLHSNFMRFLEYQWLKIRGDVYFTRVFNIIG